MLLLITLNALLSPYKPLAKEQLAFKILKVCPHPHHFLALIFQVPLFANSRALQLDSHVGSDDHADFASNVLPQKIFNMEWFPDQC